MQRIERDPAADRLAFTVLAIEAAAKRMNRPAADVYERLVRTGLITTLIHDCYDVLHTQSVDAVAADVEEALKNREQTV